MELLNRLVRGAVAPLLACFLVTSVAGTSATAAQPSSGAITATSTSVEWVGEYRQASAGEGCPPAGDPLMYCDRYSLEVDLPSDYWQGPDDGLLVQINWGDDADKFRLCILAPGETRVVCDSGIGPGVGEYRFGSRYWFIRQARSGTYEIRVQYESVVESGYTGSASAELSRPEQPRVKPAVVFDSDTNIQFSPATVVSPHFLGTEPMMAVERPAAGSAPGDLDPDRIFVDWPLGSTSATGQLSRSEDGGDSFRLLFDRSCSTRNRPNCGTGGGGDTDVAVNPVNGHVYFTDLESLGNVALASSTNHGDSFPASREHVVSNPVTAIDRQWVIGVPPGLVKVDDDKNPLTPDVGVEAFMSYEVGLLSKTIQGVTSSGRPISQPTPQIRDGSGRTGPLRFDPIRKWLYHPVGVSGQYGIANVAASNYQKGLGESGGWEANVVADSNGGWIPLFSWLALDAAGNAYTVWLQEPTPSGSDRGWRIHYSFSDIDHPANRLPGGRPGTAWSAPVTVSLPEVGSAIFPQVVAGDAGRIAINYLGTSDYVGDPQEAPSDTKWDVYTAILTNALAKPVEGRTAGGELRIATGKVNHRTVHTGSVCWGGARCEVGVPEDPTGVGGGGDRSLADMMDIGIDATGRVAVVYGDNHSSFAYVNPTYREKPFPHFAKQVSGPSLLLDAADPAIAAGGEIASDESNGDDAAGDATWPNTSKGVVLPTLDITDASITLEGENVVARVALYDAASDLMSKDLNTYRQSYANDPPRRRLQYVLRFLTENEIYHLSMEHKPGGARRFFGGKLDQNDRLTTRPGYDFVNGAGYHSDPISVSGAVQDGELVLTAPASQLDLGPGSKLFSVTAFAMAGPWEEDEKTLEDVMRTVDATAPFDHTLPTPGTSPSPDPSDTITPTPSLSPSGTESPRPEPTSSPSPKGTDIPPSSSVVRLTLAPSEDSGDVGQRSSVVATATDAGGRPVAGARVEWETGGVGTFLNPAEMTNENGQATAVLVSEEPGDQWIVATAFPCASDGFCADSAVRHHGPEVCDLYGTRRFDLLRGTSASEVICAFGGNDVVLGGGGNDVILGGRGNDRLYGEGGADRIFGRGGDDELRGGARNDLLVGGRGVDLMFGGRGWDRCRGGENMTSCRV